MKNLHFSISITAPVHKVYDMMLGISNKKTYEMWTALFNPTSTYEGSWNKGNKILFLGTDENGAKGGMVSEVVENIMHRFVSIKHYGLLIDGKEITTGAEVEKWTGGLENYTFIEINENTTVKVELHSIDEFVEYFSETYPLALNKLKEICEQ
jgi:hypothetical protein